MTRSCGCIAAVMLVALMGCGAPAPVEEPAAQEPLSPEQRPSIHDGMTMQGIDLYMHKRVRREGMADKPEVWVRAERLAIGENNTYHFENARAVIYGRDESEEVVIEAARGGFEQDVRAVLEGDVRLTAGTLRMMLRDVEWTRPEDGTAGMARSDNPVIIDDPDLQLNAAGLRLYPDTQEFVLNEVSGVIRFVEKIL